MSSSPLGRFERRKFRSARGAIAIGGTAVGALLAGLVAVSPAAAAPDAVSVPAQADASLVSRFTSGNYIVRLKDEPVATYDGGVNGFRATQPAPGAGLDSESVAAQDYSSYLANRQRSLAQKVGATPTYQYTLAFNGFAATLSPQQAARLAKSSSVAEVVADEKFEVTADAPGSTAPFLGLDGDDGVWSALGGVDEAGEGVVVGVLDSGIAPENPFFAGDELGTGVSTTKPYLDGDEVTFLKGDGEWFSSPMTADIPDQGWSTDAYNTKLIAAHFYDETYSAFDVISPDEYLSPRDFDGHGSHTASTAAGDADVTGTVSGSEYEHLSGMAPAAKVASYKVCWQGTDPTVNAGCYTSDTIAGVEQAVEDGVDVLNFSVGGSTDTVWDPVDEAFFGAASAGIFIAVAGGNSGPAKSTVEHGAPWYTTVAASTWGGFLGTVTLGDGQSFVGPTVTLDSTLEGDIVASENVPAGGVSPDDARLCAPDSLDADAVAGKVLLCDRGTYLFTEKIAEAERVDAAALIIVNANAASNGVQAMMGDIPIIHLPIEARTALYDYIETAADPTVTLTPGDVEDVTPVPQVADFSSRGPILSGGGDLIKPDIAAPGVDVLASGANAPGEAGEFEVLSGTSMASPHVAGIGALYLGAHPLATPSEIKSAMMTTARNTVRADGKAVKNPFSQGAGNVVPAKFLDAGLLFLSGAADWKRFVAGTGDAAFAGTKRIDPSKFNSPSIAIGDLVEPETVKRTVTATEGGTYKATVSGMKGIDVTVSPSRLTLDGAGDTATFRVTFDRADADLDRYATGFLSWKKKGTTVRIPLAVHPSSVIPDESVSGVGTHGSVDVGVTGGFDGKVDLEPAGLVVGETTIFEDTMTGDYQLDFFDVAEDDTLVSLDVRPVQEDPLNDLDLYLIAFDPATGEPVLIAQSATANAAESLTLTLPAGSYAVEIDTYLAPPEGVDIAYSRTVFDEAAFQGSFEATPDPLRVKEGAESSYSLSWKGLEPGAAAVGFVYYEKSPYVTVVQVTADPKPTLNEEPPTISGDPSVGGELEADPGRWEYPNGDLDFDYTWLSDGTAIDGATGDAYEPALADVGHDLSVLVTATYPGGKPGRAESDAVIVEGATSTTYAVLTDPITTASAIDVAVTVSTPATSKPTGQVRVQIGSDGQVVNLQKFHHGTVVVTFPKRKAGTYPIEVDFLGGPGLAASSATDGTITVTQ